MRMSTKRVWIATIAVMAALFVLALAPAVAGASDLSNQQCLVCHGTAGTPGDMDFEVGAVDRATACRTCHLDSLAGTHPFHNGGGNCGAVCHTGWGDSLIANVPTAVYSYGAFASPSSQDTTAGILHIIHAKPRWMSSLKANGDDCGRCHAVASCNACHNGTPAPASTHGMHGDPSAGFIATTSPVAPWTGDLATGPAKLNGASLRCGGAACHDIDGTGDAAPVLMDNFSHAAYPESGYAATTVSLSGSWTTKYGSAYTAGQQILSNYAGATAEVTFNGERLVLVGDRDPYRGIAEIYIDSVLQGTVDFYNGTTKQQDPVWTSGALAPGNHTLQIRVTGTKHASARSAFVPFDQLKVYVVSPGSVAPNCASCHSSEAVDQGDNHFGMPIVLEFSHEATAVATQIYNTGFGNYTCSQCHVMVGNSALRTEHGRASTNWVAGVTNSCGVCHAIYSTPASNYASTTIYPSPYWVPNQGCDYDEPTLPGCHIAPRDRHGAVTSKHATVTTGPSATCSSCHTGDLRAVHNNSIPGNGYLETNGCLACHGTNKYPSTNNCTAAGCHVATGITSVDTHGYDAVKHTAATFTRAFQDSAELDDGGVECNVCHTATLNTAHSEAPAVSCTTGGAGGLGCHEDTAYNSKTVAAGGWTPEKCVTCHDYSTKVSHNDTVTPHATLANGCGGSSAGCHPSTNLWDLHATSQSGGAPKYQSCSSVNSTGTADPFACHVTTAKDTRPVPAPVANSCGSTSSGCHQNISLGTHPGGFAHVYTTVSYYAKPADGAAETGCTNQAGCHNVEGAATTDFAALYHPASGCVSGPCHTSGSWSKDPADDDCQTCHNGSYTGAPSRASLTASPTSGGHYSETTHTATGMTASLVPTGGALGATCVQCHSPSVGGVRNGLANQHTQISVAGSPYGSKLSCGECHADTRSRGASEVAGNWATDTCADCHTSTATSKFDHATKIPEVFEVTTSCGSTGTNCHVSTDLHILHKGASGGGCFLTGCHNSSQQANVPTSKSCGVGGACHGTYTATTHTHGLGGDASKHQPTNSTQASDTSFFGTACGACHDIRNSNSSLTLEHTATTSAKSTVASNNCRNCHNNSASTTAIGNNWSAKDSTTACQACHTGGLAIHATENAATHTVTSSGCSSSGTGCHNGSDLSDVGAVNVVNTNIHSSCLRCHDRTASGGNLAYNPANKTCGDGRNCHATAGQYNTTTYVHNGLGGLANGNDVDHHTATAGSMASVITSGSTSTACSVCHSSGLERSHATTLATNNLGSGNTAWTNACTGCHNNNVAPIANSDDQVKAGWSTDVCSDCHATYHDTIGAANHTGSSTQGCANSGANCHPTANLVTLHSKTATGCQVSGCHTTAYKDGRPPVANKTCGSGGVCHTTYTSAQAFTHANSQETTAHAPTAGNTVQANAAWSVGGGSYTCTQCHIVTRADGGLMSAEHTSTYSTKTVDATNVCKNCHNNAASNTAITSNWSQKDTTTACAQCHTGGLAIHADENVATHTVTNTGCGNSGIGCHNTNNIASTGSTATAANNVIHNSCMRCHDRASATTTWSSAMIGTAGNLKYNPNVKTCGGASGCHTSASYSSTTYFHRIGRSDTASGTDAKHLDSVMTGTLGTGANNTCASCHSATLAPSHNTTMTGWANSCTGCHNSALASNVAPTEVKGNWTNNDCLDCHTAGASGTKIANWHSKWGTASHVGTTANGNTCDEACHASYTTLDLADIHDGRPAGCAVTGCHSVDKAMTANPTCGGVGATCHSDKSDGNHGVSTGGSPCYQCHGELQQYMEDGTGAKTGSSRTTVYHHVIGSATSDGDTATAGGTGPYPTSATDVYCISCHVDHNYFNTPAVGANFRTNIASTSVNATSTDYVNSAGSGYGICASCHATARAKDMTNQKPGSGTENVPAISGAQYAGGTHQYSVTTTYSKDGTAFRADCSKCHDDENSGGRNSRQIATHYSSEKRLLAILGATIVTGDEAQENACFKCHTGDTAGADGYGVRAMSQASRRIQTVFGKTSAHPVLTGGTATLECQSCHNTHLSTTLTETVDPNNTYNRLAYATDADTTTFCLRCHDGNVPAKQVDGAVYVPATITINPVNAGFVNKSTYAVRGHWTPGAANSTTNSIGAAETAACADCHDQHGSAAPKLLGVYNPASNVNAIGAVTITGNNNDVCRGCHTNASTGYGLATASRNASGYPVDGTWPGSVVASTALDAVTHAGNPHNAANVVWPGTSYASGDCKNCHDVHGTANTFDALRGTPATSAYSPSDQEFCFTCHGGVGPATRDIEQYYPLAMGGDSTADNAGHNIQTPGALLPVGRGMPCYMCHNPHGSANQYGLTIVTMSGGTTITVGDGAGEINMDPTSATRATDVRKFCFTCHTTADGSSGWNGSAMTSVTSGNVLGINRITYDTTNKRGLKLPTNIAEHFFASVVNCYDCHGNDYTTNVSYNAHNPSPGVSNGGRNCYDCHSSYLAYMEDGTGSRVGSSRTTAYHHVMGDGTTNATGQGDYPFAQGGYPTSQTNVFCLSCHVDHSLFNADKGSNLRTNLNATAVATNTDFTAATQTGVCQSCHAATKTKDNANQKAVIAPNSTAVPLISGANFATSAHQYAIPSTFGGSTYNANCVKCHSDESLKQYQTSPQKFAVHWSAEGHILQSLGAAINAAGEAQENHCWECHSTDINPYGAAGKDGHNIGSMSTTATAIKGMFELNSTHPIATASNVECQNCHNVHITSGTTETADPDNTYNKVNWNTPAEQATYCLKCHDGTPPTQTINGTTYVPQTVTIDATDTTRVNKATYAVRGHWAAGASGSTTNSISAAETMACGKCHDNHGSSVEHLLGSRNVAAGSNQIVGTVKTVTLTANNYTVCDACHQNSSTGYPATASHNTSGYPSDGRWPGMTQFNNATTGIHRVGRANVVYPGSTNAAGECNNCHDVHGTANTYDDLKSTYSTSNFSLCFDCHDGSPSTINIKQFYPVAAGGTSSDTNAGHKIKNAGGYLPAGNALPCYGCHNTHGSISADGLQVLTQVAANTTITIGGSTNAFNLGTAAGIRNFCFSCHTTSNTNAGWNGTAMATVVSGAKVFGLDRISTSYRLRLPVTSGHASTDTQSCYQCHGNTYTAGGNNAHNPGAGGGNGGIACDGCHTDYALMANSTGSFHHVLDDLSPFAAPSAGTYSTNDQSLQCVSCHTDHNYFSTNKAANLRTTINNSSATATNTDYVPGAAGGASVNYGICVSCHDARFTKNTTGQKSGGATVTPLIDGALYDLSAHDYTVNGSFGSDTFRANCSKCHDDEQDANSKMTSTYKFGTHISSSSGIARALGATLPVGAGQHTVEENLCYRCHQGDTAGLDGYGVQAMTARARTIQSSYQKTYKHAVASSTVTGRHKADEYDTAPTSINGTSTASAGWYGTGLTKRHSECEDCHNPHVARAEATTEFPDINNPRGSNAVAISPANEGVWGVNITGPTNSATGGNWSGSSSASGTGNPAIPYYSKIQTATYEWQFCLKCHSRYAWGNQTTPTVPSGGQNGVAGTPMTDVGQDFNPANYAFHPLFAIGRNQPSANLNTNWTSGTQRRWASGAYVTGLSNTFVDGWYATSRVTCSDCHGNDTWGGTIARGVHGSSRKWLVRGVNTGIKTTTNGGSTVLVSNAAFSAGSYCANCHRGDVYGDGDADDPTSNATSQMSRANHGSGFTSCDADTRAPNQVNGCNNCHGGRSDQSATLSKTNGNMHGSSMGMGTDGNDGTPLGFRFCNGASWDAHQFGRGGTTTIGCSTINATDGFSQCNQHDTWNEKSTTALYNY